MDEGSLRFDHTFTDKGGSYNGGIPAVTITNYKTLANATNLPQKITQTSTIRTPPRIAHPSEPSVLLLNREFLKVHGG